MMSMHNFLIVLYYRLERYNCLLKLMIYKLLFWNKMRIGSGFHVRKGFTFFAGEGAMIKIGKNVFFNRFCSVNCLDNITIGDNCLFGENVHIYDHNHKFRMSCIPIAEQGFAVAPIKIGSNCWIGSNVVILKGVQIGNHVVIGAGVVVNKDIPDNALVTNNGRYSCVKMNYI